MALGTAAAIAAAAPAVGGMLGGLFSRGDKKKAQEAAQKAIDIINSLGAPPDLSKQIMLEQFKSAGLYDPKLEEAIDQTVSQMAQLKESPEARDAQMAALGSLQQSGRTGLTATDREALNQERLQNARDVEGKMGQIRQEAQQRGQGGGSSELAASLLASQAGADRASAAGDRTASIASQNALNAMGQSGQLAGNIRTQDFDVNKTKAAAADEMNRFNVQNAINRQMRNVGSANAAQQGNLASNQAIMNANTAQGNQELQRQSEASRQYWSDTNALAAQKAGAQQAAANIYNKKAADTAQGAQNVGSGVGAAAGAFANLKKTITPADTMAAHAVPAPETPDEYYMRTGYKKN